MAKKAKAQVESTQADAVVDAVETPAVETPAVETPTKEVKVKPMIGKQVVELILANPDRKNQDILDEIKANNPTAKTSYACIAWYKSDLRKKGMIAARAKKTAVETMIELEEAQA